MIKIKYKILQENENTLDILTVFEDNTYTVLNLIKDDDTLKNAYILSKNTDRKPYTGTLDDLETYVKSESVPTKVKTNFSTLTAQVYDQYGDLMEIQPNFEVQGTDKAKIKDGKLLTEEVTEDTSFFVVARCGDLEQRQERFLYAPVEPVPDPQEQRLSDLETALAEILGIEVE